MMVTFFERNLLDYDFKDDRVHVYHQSAL